MHFKNNRWMAVRHHAGCTLQGREFCALNIQHQHAKLALLGSAVVIDRDRFEPLLCAGGGDRVGKGIEAVQPQPLTAFMPKTELLNAQVVQLVELPVLSQHARLGAIGLKTMDQATTAAQLTTQHDGMVTKIRTPDQNVTLAVGGQVLEQARRLRLPHMAGPLLLGKYEIPSDFGPVKEFKSGAIRQRFVIAIILGMEGVNDWAADVVAYRSVVIQAAFGLFQPGHQLLPERSMPPEQLQCVLKAHAIGITWVVGHGKTLSKMTVGDTRGLADPGRLM